MDRHNLTISTEKRTQHEMHQLLYTKKNVQPLIELSAIAGKIAIDQTNLHPVAKSSIKWTIDQVARILKEECASDIEKICNAAEHYNIQKVIAIPFPVPNGQHIVFIRAYGENSKSFFDHLRIRILSENTSGDILRYISELENETGVVIYPK